MSDCPTAVVLAGGFGTRIRHLLPDVPKPMAPVCGKPFLEWVVRYLAHEGISRIVLSTGHLAQVIAGHFAAQPVPGVSISCVPETEPLGTAGGFLNAGRNAGHTPSAWLVLNGDSLVLTPLEPARRQFAEPGVEGVLVGCRVPDASRYGTLALGPRSDLLGFLEKRPGAGVISAGVYLMKHPLLEAFPRARPLSFETEVFPTLIRGGHKLKVHPVEAPFLDIGTPETLRQAEAFIEANRRNFFVA